MIWAYGVTTVPEREYTTLIPTLDSLHQAGFGDPWLFVDGSGSVDAGIYMRCRYTLRYPKVGAFGNWVLGMWELYLRNPGAERYAMFQDDILICRNVKDYLDLWFPQAGYLNLYTTKSVEDQLAARLPSEKRWQRSMQAGRGALALVFNHEALYDLFRQPLFVHHPRSIDRQRGKQCIDGVVCDSMNACGRSEYVHSPSLVQHREETTVIETPEGRVSHDEINAAHGRSQTFPGEEFDATEFAL